MNGNGAILLDELLSMTPDEVQVKFSTTPAVDESVLRELVFRWMEILKTEPNVLQLTSPITICGDIHGQLFDLFNLFKISGGAPTTKYLFLGDYVDRGHHSVLTIAYLVYLKVKYPDRIYLLRGNHECLDLGTAYTFRNECADTYGHYGIFRLFNTAFEFLPLCAVVDRQIFCVHGGISPKATLVSKIDVLHRQNQIPHEGLITDLTWSDPREDGDGFGPNNRGAGCVFGPTPTKEFLRINGLNLIARSHQLTMDGFRWFYDKNLLLVWSAPNYCYREGNMASVFVVKDSSRDVKVFEADPQSSKDIVQVSDTMISYFA
jgi:diadenosine tetraphosphatase ApaH/serine/threonine PP2A family protein phosphatase